MTESEERCGAPASPGSFETTSRVPVRLLDFLSFLALELWMTNRHRLLSIRVRRRLARIPGFSIGRPIGVSGFPSKIILESTNRCNAKCAFCPIDGMTRTRGSMPMEMFYRLVDEIAEHRDVVREVYLHMDGEPLLAPFIEDRMRYIKNKRIGKLIIVTNASRLTPQIAETMISCKVDAVICSCEGPPAVVHETSRPPLKFDRVRDNILMLSAKRRSVGALRPFVIVRTVLTASTKPHLREYLSFWRGKVSGVSILEEHSWAGANPGPHNGSYRPRFPCAMVFDTMIIHHDGNVPLCCMDFNGNFRMGNAFEEGIRQVWNNGSFARIRTSHEDDSPAVPSLCQQCAVREDVTNKPLAWPLYR